MLGLITQRSQVQILSPQQEKLLVKSRFRVFSKAAFVCQLHFDYDFDYKPWACSGGWSEAKLKSDSAYCSLHTYWILSGQDRPGRPHTLVRRFKDADSRWPLNPARR